MERLTNDDLLEYNPDTLTAIRELYNLDKPGQMDEAIDLLDGWLRKQSHLVRKDFPRDYLERVIIMLKGSVERAKAQIDKICTLRTLLPDFFVTHAINDLKEINGFLYSSLLPKLTKDHCRLYLTRYEPKQFTSKILLKMYYFIVIVCEYLKARDYSNGLIAVTDLRGVNIMDFVTQINLTELRQMTTIALEGYDCRMKKFIFVSSSKTIEILIKLFKQVVSEKLGSRVLVVKTTEELHEHVPKEFLPSDYGGDEKSLVELHDRFLEVLCSEKNIQHFKEMSKSRTNESMRTSSKSNEQFAGLAGTFRTLAVD